MCCPDHTPLSAWRRGTMAIETVSSQLEQILGYLDKDGVSEIVVAVGRPSAMRQKGAYVNLTQRPLTTAMLWAFVEGSEIAPLIPHGDGSFDQTDLDVGRRRLRIRTGWCGFVFVVCFVL